LSPLSPPPAAHDQQRWTALPSARAPTHLVSCLCRRPPLRTRSKTNSGRLSSATAQHLLSAAAPSEQGLGVAAGPVLVGLSRTRMRQAEEACSSDSIIVPSITYVYVLASAWTPRCSAVTEEVLAKADAAGCETAAVKTAVPPKHLSAYFPPFLAEFLADLAALLVLITAHRTLLSWSVGGVDRYGLCIHGLCDGGGHLKRFGRGSVRESVCHERLKGCALRVAGLRNAALCIRVVRERVTTISTVV
jgi:hypothetical protein